MGKVRTEASLHQKTVQRAAMGDIPAYAKELSRRLKRKRYSKVKHTHYLDGVDPLIVAWVRENKINYRRVEVVSPTAIIIHNPKVK